MSYSLVLYRQRYGYAARKGQRSQGISGSMRVHEDGGFEREECAMPVSRA